jgi:hypothetical protein
MAWTEPAVPTDRALSAWVGRFAYISLTHILRSTVPDHATNPGHTNLARTVVSDQKRYPIANFVHLRIETFS